MKICNNTALFYTVKCDHIHCVRGIKLLWDYSHFVINFTQGIIFSHVIAYLVDVFISTIASCGRKREECVYHCGALSFTFDKYLISTVHIATENREKEIDALVKRKANNGIIT